MNTMKTIEELRAYLEAQPKDREAWFKSIGADVSKLSPYEEGYADGALQAYGHILDKLK